ncbi:MAG: L-histidine N(alpha)-methyltransferase [Cyclobacteriaceae bacterium]
MTQFKQDVLEGLSSNPKRLSSRYFYDEKGDQLFQKIMQLEEYYLSRAELCVFENHKARLLELMRPQEHFRIIELGAGDGSKTKVLLKHFTDEKASFSYCPVDISKSVLQTLRANLEAEIPNLNVEPKPGDYFQILHELKFQKDGHNVVYFLGSNIGNFLNETATGFLSSIRENLNTGDRMLIGFDLKKDPAKILAAYNDSKGVTRQFNLNLLARINTELGADFDLEAFAHNPVYDPMTGECRSYLVSLQDQEVFISSLDKRISFRKWEPIFVEVSKKYDQNEIAQLAESSGFKVVENLFDPERLFTDSVWEVV